MFERGNDKPSPLLSCEFDNWSRNPWRVRNLCVLDYINMLSIKESGSRGNDRNNVNYAGCVS